MTRRDCLRMGGILGCALISSVASAFDAPGAPIVDIVDPDTPQSGAIARFFSRGGVTAGNVPGAAVLVENDNRVLFQRGYGFTVLVSLHQIKSGTNGKSPRLNSSLLS